MASLAKILAANNAAASTAKQFEEVLAADFKLLLATNSLLSQVQGMLRSNTPRQTCEQAIVNHKEVLAPMLKKYGVELVPSARYVDGVDIRIIGSTTPNGIRTAKTVNMVAMDVETTMEAEWQDFAKAPQPAQPAAGSRVLDECMKQADQQVRQSCGIPTPKFKPGCY